MLLCAALTRCAACSGATDKSAKSQLVKLDAQLVRRAATRSRAAVDRPCIADAHLLFFLRHSQTELRKQQAALTQQWEGERAKLAAIQARGARSSRAACVCLRGASADMFSPSCHRRRRSLCAAADAEGGGGRRVQGGGARGALVRPEPRRGAQVRAPHARCELRPDMCMHHALA